MSWIDNAIAVTRKTAESLPTRDALLQTFHAQQSTIAELEETLDKKSAVISSQKTRIAALEECLRLAKAKRFGASSETHILQAQLFNEAELLGEGEPSAEDDSGELEPDNDTPAPKKRRARRGLSADLPRVQIHLRLSEAEKAGAIDTFFVKVKEELDIVPARAQVIEYLQEKAVFVDGDGQRSLKVAERPPRALGKSIASVSLLAFIIISKYADGLPLYRLEGILKRYGGSITRTAMANWLIRLSAELQPVVNLLAEVQRSADYLQGDETRMQVLKEPGMDPKSHKWMWVLRSGPPDQPVVLFNYDKSRGKAVAERLLEDFEGRYFQSDGYAGYDGPCAAKGVVHLGCWDHARRKFVEAIQAAPNARKTHGRPSKAEVGLSHINALYRIEREMESFTAEDKQAHRQQHSVVRLEALKQWLEKNAPSVEKDSKTRKAMDYTLNQWPKLIRYCDDGNLRISNVLAENAIRPFAVGRKAWLFADTPAGAKASAIYFSLIETAKANGLEPSEYLRYLIERIATADTVEAYEALLPWNMK